MKLVAEEYLGEPVSEAVITVPAYFNDAQRQAPRTPAASPGSTCSASSTSPPPRRWPTASATKTDEKIAVYDLGGGTFDISILEMGKGVFEVLATAGNTFLGGEDFDRRIVELAARGLPAERGHRPAQRHDGAAAAQGRRGEGEVRPLAARAPRDQPAVHRDRRRAGPRHLSVELTREELERLVRRHRARARSRSSSTPGRRRARARRTSTR